MRRANWSAPADALPDDLAGWARERGLPRRVFARSPLERKPRYVDFESPTLLRHAQALRRAGRRTRPVEFTEMLPGARGVLLRVGHHTSEFRVVALDGRQAQGMSA